MGNTTFSGAVRSEGGFQVVTKESTGAMTVNSEIGSIATLPTEAGTGITTGTGTVYASSITEQGGIVTTQIMIDVTGLRSTGVGDIIGVDGTALVCHIGQITAARNGTILGGSVTCLEVPAGGEPDIDVYSATEGTGVEDGAVGDLTETQLVNTGDHTLGLVSTFTAVPAADEYLYLVAQGTGSDADYTAGKLLIELKGYRA